MGLKSYNYDIKVKNYQAFSNSHKIKSHCEFQVINVSDLLT